MNSIILIGPIIKGGVPCTGDTVKNQLFLKRFNEVFDKVFAVDTYRWQKRPWCLLEIMCKVLFHKRDKIVVSANPGSADKIFSLLRVLGISKRSFYWVVGGSFHKMIECKRFKVRNYRELKGIFVQGESMVKTLYASGLTNVMYVPNSKYINHIPHKSFFNDDKFHFVFLSRVEREKGCDDIFRACNLLRDKGYEGKFDITFYGKTTTDLSYKDVFEKAVNMHSDLIYKGLLDLRDLSNYDELANYNVMLFPTFWDGEGFPGVIIDAYIAGLPVIASDWNLNKDVVEDGKTGWIIPSRDVEALAEKMIFAIEHPEIVKLFSENSSAKAMEYDSRNVLSEENLKKIGLL